MGNLSLTLATGPYDRVEAIAKGEVRPEGIDVTCLQIQSPPEIFTRMMKTRAFDLCEMSLSTYLTRRSRGDRFRSSRCRCFRRGCSAMRTST